MRLKNLRLKGNLTSCRKCKGTEFEVQSYADTVDFRNLALDIEGLERSKCLSCGHLWESNSQLESNQLKVREEYVSARDRLRSRYGLLTGEQIAESRIQLSLNQKEAAALFGGGTNSFNKYESGEVLQSFAMDRLIRMTAVLGSPAVEFLRDVDAVKAFKAELQNSYKGGNSLEQTRELRKQIETTQNLVFLTRGGKNLSMSIEVTALEGRTRVPFEWVEVSKKVVNEVTAPEISKAGAWRVTPTSESASIQQYIAQRARA